MPAGANIKSAAAKRLGLAGAKASGKVNIPPQMRGGVKYPAFGVHATASTKDV